MHITLHRRLLRLTLIATVWTFTAVSQTTSTQTAVLGPPSLDYIDSLELNSMLFQADMEALRISGNGVQWEHKYGTPQTTQLVKTASVWFLYYPASVIPIPGTSVLGTWASQRYWDTLHDIGIELQHTDPIERAGGITANQFTPTIDGWFDRITLDIDPVFGTTAEMQQMSNVAKNHGAIIGSDLVPLHTGLGGDFRLAEFAFKDYPGMYTMVEINQQDWGLLPTVTDPWGHELVSRDSAMQLTQKGYIPGLINSADANPDAKTWSGWSATPEVIGVDGKRRRWVYLHVFKPAQPTMNWLDPSYASRRTEYGDTARNILDYGARVLRLDAAPFLGIEQSSDSMAITFLHPLATVGTDDLAMMARKLGGWTFEELNVPIEQLNQFTANGPDLSYDFFTRAQVLHPLITGDALPLRLAFNLLLQHGGNDGALIHDMQNHDEITYQLIDLGSRGDIQFEGKTVNGAQLKQQILDQMRAREDRSAVPFNILYRPEQDGISTTFAGFIAPALGIQDPYHATPEQVALIQRAHFLTAQANAMQPGVFGISAWDLVGALPIPLQSISSNLTEGGDSRWINRGAVDLLGANPNATQSAVLGLPKATTLYGPLPEQLNNPNSFASQIKRMLAARKQARINEAQLLSAPDVGNTAVCVLIMKLPDSNNVAITALNYGRNSASFDVDLSNVSGIQGSFKGQTAHDIIANMDTGTVSDAGKLTVNLDDLSGKTLVVMSK